MLHPTQIIRVFIDGEFHHITKYQMVYKEKSNPVVKFQLGRTAIQTEDFNLCACFVPECYEKDIVEFTYNDVTRAGVVRNSPDDFGFVIDTMDQGIFPMVNCSDWRVCGDLYTSPDMLEFLDDLYSNAAQEEQVSEPTSEKEPGPLPETKEPEPCVEDVVGTLFTEEDLAFEHEVSNEPVKTDSRFPGGHPWVNKGFDQNKVFVFTDGAALENPGPAGAGIVIKSGSFEYMHSEPLGNFRTNNYAEMMAAILALDMIPENCAVTLSSDSQYLVNGFAKGWLKNWKKNGWVSSSGTPVKNRDLWEKLDALNQKHRISWQWIKGHDGHPENELCDQLANQAALKNRQTA